MTRVTNTEIRLAARERGVALWQIAEVLHISDNTFYRMLRRELDEEQRARVLKAINEIAEGGE